MEGVVTILIGLALASLSPGAEAPTVLAGHGDRQLVCRNLLQPTTPSLLHYRKTEVCKTQAEWSEIARRQRLNDIIRIPMSAR